MKRAFLLLFIASSAFCLGWHLNVGSFPERTEAESLCKYLIDRGYPAYVLYDDALSVVRVGPFGDLSVASAVKEKLAANEKISADVVEEELFDKQQIADMLPGRDVSQNDLVACNDEVRRKIIQMTIDLFGHPYKYGGNIVGSGIDCSYYTQSIFRELNINIPRTAKEQFKVGRAVELGELKVGDLIFFKKTYYAKSGKKKIPYTRINHVGIYLGGGEFIHATVNAKKVTISKISEPYYMKRYAGSRRIL